MPTKAQCDGEMTVSIFPSISCAWAGLWNSYDPAIGVPPAPTGSSLTLPPASGTDASLLVSNLTDQQMANQQASNATNVISSTWDQILGGINNLPNIIPNMGIGILVIAGVLGLVAIGGGSPRRYGR